MKLFMKLQNSWEYCDYRFYCREKKTINRPVIRRKVSPTIGLSPLVLASVIPCLSLNVLFSRFLLVLTDVFSVKKRTLR